MYDQKESWENNKILLELYCLNNALFIHKRDQRFLLLTIYIYSSSVKIQYTVRHRCKNVYSYINFIHQIIYSA